MRMLLTVLILPLAASLIEATTHHVAENSSNTSAKHASRKSHGKTIQQLIGGHAIFNRVPVRNLGNNIVKQSNYSAAEVLIKKQNKKNIDLIKQTDGLLMTSAGNGKNWKEVTSSLKKEESKKSLSDQVAEGKYGLIHEELFKTKPKRPGVLSYKINSDVSKDDSRHYGGLKDEEIWLAEDYLLVIRGGFVNKNGNAIKWNPIDDYSAPSRQVKLPLNPKVPPPFPVQLTDDGPIQFIGNNKLPSYNPFTNQSIFLFSNKGVPYIKAEDLNKKSTASWNGKDNAPPQFNGYQYPPPAPLPLSGQNHTFSNPFLNLPPLPILGSMDEPNNTSIDEDNPSQYYPPPYTFEYKNNYNNPVSPGPLVPGIILPPPPNFFASLEQENNTTLSQINPIITERKPITIETPTFKIEIEKVNVKKIPENNEIVNTFRPVIGFPLANSTTKITRRRKPQRVKTQLHRVNTQMAGPLISLSPGNFTGTPIYFEYFDAKAPTLNPFHDFYMTTSVPYLSTFSTEGYKYKATTENPMSKSSLNPKQHTSQTSLPVEHTGFYVEHDLENDRFKTIKEFNREIASLKQTLRLYENVLPLISREPKSQRPIYNSQFDFEQSSSVQPIEKPHKANNIYQNSLSSQSIQQFQRFNKLGHHNYSYKDYSANIGMTSANPVGYTSFINAKPFYFAQPNWYNFENVKVHEIPNPLVYNNGASGYNNKLTLAEKSTHRTNVAKKPVQQQRDNPVIQISRVHNKNTYFYRTQQKNEAHLLKDTLVNFKHPLPVIDPDSEELRINGMRTKPIIQYQLPGEKAHVYFITPQELKYL